MPLRLHESAHHAERHDRILPAFVIHLRDEAGNDGVIRSLAAADLIRMSALKREARAAILQMDSSARE